MSRFGFLIVFLQDPEYIKDETVYWVKWKRYEQRLDDEEATKIMRMVYFSLCFAFSSDLRCRLLRRD